MSAVMKLQSKRENPRKVAVVKDYLGWWAQVQMPNGAFINRIFRSHSDALAKAFQFAAGDFEDAA